MRLKMLAKDESSRSGGCPSMYLAEDGMFVVQAQEADADTYGTVQNLLPGEKVVQIKPQVILDAVARYQAR